MAPSVAGALVCVALLVVGWLAGDSILVALFASIPFGATAIATVGGSSPLIYTVFAGLFILKVVMRGNFFGSFYAAAKAHPPIIITAFLAAYALGGAIILPRLLAGETSVFVPVDGIIRELPLAPVGGNLNQAAYFVMGGAAFVFMTIYLSDTRNQYVMRLCLFSFAIADTLLGVVDLAGKFVGGGDVLAFIRTASYAMLTEEQIGGFARITGGCSEASAYAGLSLASLGFTFSYWRNSGSPLALALTVCTVGLLVFSTSTTAYVGLGLLAALAALSIGATLITANFQIRDLLLLLAVLAVLTLALGVYLYNEKLFDPLTRLLHTMVFEKRASSSGQERGYWNSQSIKSIFDTYGLGVGLGSSRSSSLLISIIAQLGVIGALLFGSLTVVAFRGADGIGASVRNDLYAIASGARGMVIGLLASSCIAGSGADPGILFFLLLSVIVTCRRQLVMQQSRPGRDR